VLLGLMVMDMDDRISTRIAGVSDVAASSQATGSAGTAR